MPNWQRTGHGSKGALGAAHVHLQARAASALHRDARPHHTTALSAGTEGASLPPAASIPPTCMSVEGGRTSLIFSWSPLLVGPAPAEHRPVLCRSDAVLAIPVDPSSWGTVVFPAPAPSIWLLWLLLRENFLMLGRLLSQLSVRWWMVD